MPTIDIYEIVNPNVPEMRYYLLQVFNIRDIAVDVIYQKCHTAEYNVSIYNNGFNYIFKIYVSGNLPNNLHSLLPYILLSRYPYYEATFSENKCRWYCKLFTLFECHCFSNKHYLMSWRFSRRLGEL